MRYAKSNPNMVLKIIYNSQIRSSLKRGHSSPSYSMEDLGLWIEKQPQAYLMWEDWKSSGGIHI